MTTQDRHLAAKFEGCLATSVRLIDRVIASAYDDALRPLGVRSTQVTMLVTVAGLNAPTARDLVGALRMDQTTVSRNLDRLDDLGLIAREEDPEDARAARLALTNEGRQILREALPIWKAGQQKIRDAIGDPAADHLVSTASGLSGPTHD